MLSKQFKGIARDAILRGSILAVLAAVTFLYPDFLTGGMVYALAAYAILNGILGIVRLMVNKDNEIKLTFNLHLLLSGFSILLGIVCTIYFRYVISILPVFLGVVLIVGSMVHFIAALGVKSRLKPLMIILSMLTAMGGIALMVFSFGFGGIQTLSQMFGSLLVLSCFEELLILLSNQKILKRKGDVNE